MKIRTSSLKIQKYIFKSNPTDSKLIPQLY